ncbi:Epididymal secretory glutathione peroxidase [Lemmus lemmus]
MSCYKDVKGTIYDYETLSLNGKERIQFKQYAGKHVLFVNVATYCVVLGFPCNQFGKQEPGENSEILPGLKCFLFSASPLQHSCPHPSEVVSTNKHISWEPVKEHDIRWNFEKFLVGPTGVPVMRWSHLAPVSAVKADIVAYLKQFKTK